jgi:hypothetical protein
MRFLSSGVVWATLLIASAGNADTQHRVSEAAPIAEETVRAYLLNSRGYVNGLLLNDGSQIHITSRAAQKTISKVKPRDRIRVYGTHHDKAPILNAEFIDNIV